MKTTYSLIIACLTLATGTLLTVPNAALASGGSAAEAEEEKQKALQEAEEQAEKLKAKLAEDDAKKGKQNLSAERKAQIEAQAKESSAREDRIRNGGPGNNGWVPDFKLTDVVRTEGDLIRVKQWPENSSNQWATADRIRQEQSFDGDAPGLAAYKAARANEDRTKGAELAAKVMDENLRVGPFAGNDKSNNQALPKPEEARGQADFEFGSPSFLNGFEGAVAAKGELISMSAADRQTFLGWTDLRGALTTFYGRLDAARRRKLVPPGKAGLPPAPTEDTWRQLLTFDAEVKQAAIDADSLPRQQDPQSKYFKDREVQITKAAKLYDGLWQPKKPRE